MSVILGFQPERLVVKLSQFGDFTAALVYDDGDPSTVNEWPVGIAIALRFYPTDSATTPAVTWPATITGDRAEWHIDNAVVASAVINPGNDHARLFYTNGSVELEWAVGAIQDVR